MDLKPFLTTKFVGKHFVFFDSVDSTNRIAHDLAEQGIDEGTVICADHQTAGHGRQGRQWFSPPERNLYFSVILAPKQAAIQVSQLSLVAGVAIATTLQKYLGEDKKVGIKWPNDVWIDQKKCCGILCEMVNAGNIETQRLIIGIGVNINLAKKEIPAELKEISTSLFIEIEEITYLSREIILAQFLQELETRYLQWQQQGLGAILTEWDSFSILHQKNIVADMPSGKITGEVLGLSPEGCLRLRLSTGEEQTVSAGDIHILSISSK